MDFLPTYMKAFMIMVIFCFAVDLFVLGYYGIFHHARNYALPKIQKIVIIMMFFSFSLQSLFAVGFFIYDKSDIIDIAVEVLISILLFLFFKTLNTMMSIEAFSISHSNSQLPARNEENKELDSLFHEIKLLPVESIDNTEVKMKCIAFIMMYVRNFKHLRFCYHIIGENVIETQLEAIKFYNRFRRILLAYVIIIPLCFIGIAIIDHKELESNVPKALVNLIKAITTIYCIYNLIYYVKNLENALKEYGLLIKFFCVKLIIFFVIVQSIILTYSAQDTEHHTAAEMGQIINYFLLNIENCALGILWILSFGFEGLCIKKYTNLQNNNISSELKDVSVNTVKNKKREEKENITKKEEKESTVEAKNNDSNIAIISKKNDDKNDITEILNNI